MTEILEQLRDYGKLLTDVIYIVIIGIILIWGIQWLTKKFLPEDLKHKRIVQITLGSLYSLIFVVMALLALNGLGLDFEETGELAILLILIGGVAFFFLSPYLPQLPFRVGHLVNVNGAFGKVEAISAYHTTIRKFDGAVFFIPNITIFGSTIINYSTRPYRRAEFDLNIESSCELENALEAMLRIMRTDSRVLEEPAPPFIEVKSVQASGIDVTGYCWVNIEDFITAKTSILREIVKEFNDNDAIDLSLPQQEVVLTQKNAEQPGSHGDIQY